LLFIIKYNIIKGTKQSLQLQNKITIATKFVKLA